MSADSFDANASVAQLSESAACAARLAWRIAPDTCLPATEEFPGCADYHGLYPLLHALGLAATPDRHAEFYARELGLLARTGEYSSVLISGTADQGMLEHVARAYTSTGASLEMDMLDLCPTPGLICSAWAETVNRTIRTHACNILKWKPGRQFDVITTHSFIAKFGPDIRPDLFAAWERLLRPGGKLVTTARIDSDATPESACFSDDKADGFATELARVIEPWHEVLGIDMAALGTVARRHCARIKSYAVPSVDELQSLLNDNGLKIETLSLVTHAGRLKDSQSGAGTHRTAEYAEFVASRSR